MRFSVVINTLNRATSLNQTLQALAYQSHADFEVVVVNGPSTDGTDQVLAAYASALKVVKCPVANLSMSRNLGIAASAGDVVAFIDDDAIPEYGWLRELEQGYADDETVGVGGVVFDHTGLDFQFRFGVADRYGDTIQTPNWIDGHLISVPGSWQYPSLLGTNSSFRRDALVDIGMFDETYEYYLDETDLVVRLIDAGGVVMAVDGAPVHHHFLPSHVRNERRTVTHWYPVIKNRVYFALRHARDHRTYLEIIGAAVRATEQRLEESLWAEAQGLVPPGSTDRARSDCDRAFADGVRLAEQRGIGPLDPKPSQPPPFLRFGTHADSRLRRNVADAGDEVLAHCPAKRVALITSSYPPASMGGISRFMSELAPTLARAGHDVRVITRCEAQPSVDWEDGVWVHRLLPARCGLAAGSFDHVDRFATAVVDELRRIEPWLPIDSVYGGAWDVETLGIVRATALPVTIMLATPAQVAAEEGRWFDDPQVRVPLSRLMDLERELFQTADLVHGISHAIVDTIEHGYGSGPGSLFDHQLLEVFPLGMIDRSPTVPRRDIPSAPTLLFVGRLEARKGIDVFLKSVVALAASRPDLRVVVAGSDPAGSGPSSFATRWKDEHKDQPVIEQVEFIGETPDSRLHALYDIADVVVLPSRYESFGLVVVEAMMHRAAIVSSDVGGIAEVARNGTDAILVSPGDVAGLVTAISQFLDDPDARSRFGAAARQSFEARFDVERSAARVLEFVSRATRGTPAARRLLTGEFHELSTPTGTSHLAIRTCDGATIEWFGEAFETVQVSAPGSRIHVRGVDGHVAIRLRNGTATLMGTIDIGNPEDITAQAPMTVLR